MERRQRHGKYGTDLLIPWGTNVQRRLRKQVRHKGTTRFFIYLKATDTVAQGTARGTPEKGSASPALIYTHRSLH